MIKHAGLRFIADRETGGRGASEGRFRSAAPRNDGSAPLGTTVSQLEDELQLQLQPQARVLEVAAAVDLLAAACSGLAWKRPGGRRVPAADGSRVRLPGAIGRGGACPP